MMHLLGISRIIPSISERKLIFSLLPITCSLMLSYDLGPPDRDVSDVGCNFQVMFLILIPNYSVSFIIIFLSSVGFVASHFTTANPFSIVVSNVTNTVCSAHLALPFPQST